MRYGFDQPHWLYLLVLVPLVLALGWGWLRRIAAWRRSAAMLLRAAILSLLIVALARPSVYWPDSRLSVAFVVDESDSMDGPDRAAAAAWLEQAMAARQPDDKVAVVRFGRQAVADAQSGERRAGVDGTASNIEAALRMAGDMLAPTGERRIVVLSDGWENVGDAREAAARGLPAGVPVEFAAPSGPEPRAEVAIRTVEAPRLVREGGTFEATVVVDSTVETDATVALTVDGRPAGEERVKVAAGANRFTLPLRARAQGFRALRAQITPVSDTRAENNVAETVAVVKEAGAVLVLEGRPGEGGALAEMLREGGLTVEVQAPTAVPTRAEALERFEGIALVNVAATQMTLDQQRTLQRYVQDFGRGMLVVGGPTSYSLGGYAQTPLDEMLPVSPAPPPRRDEGTLALFIVLDKSGSMDLYRSDVSKMALAREAAILATESVRPRDTLGVLGFDSRHAWVVPPAVINSPNDVKAAQAQIAGIRADGGTSIFPALEEAFKAALQADASKKHIILMTDGQSYDADYATLLGKMQDAEITLSTIAMGSDSDVKLLTRLAELGSGRYYFTERAQDIPKITTKETTIVSRNALVQGRVLPRVAEPSPVLVGLTGSAVPPLAGYVSTTARPRATTVMTTDKGDPLLAHWQWGLGRVVAWTSDAGAAWTTEWDTWPDASRFWQQAMRWTLPEPTQAQFPVQVEVIGDRVTLRAQAVRPDGRYADLLDTRVTIVPPGGQARELQLPQTAPGNYAIATVVSEPGVYEARFAQRENGQPVREETLGFTILGNQEGRAVGTNRALLERLAGLTGGKELTDPAQAFAREARAVGERLEPLWHWFALAALLLLPLDIAVRRLRFGRR
jgi:Ca-activated chloride channel homolog